MICPDCSADLEPYATPEGIAPDIHTHWCNDCHVGHILHDGKWISFTATADPYDEFAHLHGDFEQQVGHTLSKEQVVRKGKRNEAEKKEEKANG